MFHNVSKFFRNFQGEQVQSSRQKGYICKVKTKRDITAAFTGHRSYDGSGDASLAAAVRHLYGRGYRTFLTGMAAGFDLAAGECVAKLRGELEGLRLHCVVPFAGHRRSLAGEAGERYDRLLGVADEVTVLSPRYGSRAYFERNDFLVDNASVVVAWFDGSAGGTRYTVQRAFRSGVEICNLWLGLFSGPQNDEKFDGTKKRDYICSTNEV